MNPTTSLTGGTTATPRAPERALHAWQWTRERLFQSPAGILGTLLCLWLLLMTVPPLVDWLIVKATFSSPTAQGCRNAPGGACWAFIAEKHRLILFGTYPYDEQWRPLLATLALIGTLVYSAARRCRPACRSARGSRAAAAIARRRDRCRTGSAGASRR